MNIISVAVFLIYDPAFCRPSHSISNCKTMSASKLATIKTRGATGGDSGPTSRVKSPQRWSLPRWTTRISSRFPTPARPDAETRCFSGKAVSMVSAIMALDSALSKASTIMSHLAKIVRTFSASRRTGCVSTVILGSIRRRFSARASTLSCPIWSKKELAVQVAFADPVKICYDQAANPAPDERCRTV